MAEDYYLTLPPRLGSPPSFPVLPRSTSLVMRFLYPITDVAAAATKSLQSCPTLCDPIHGSTPGSSVHRIL